MPYKHHIRTSNSVILIMDDGKSIPISKENPVYSGLMNALENRDFAKVEFFIDKAKAISALSKGSFMLTENNEIVHNGHVMPNGLSRRVIEFVDNGLETDSLVKFWERLCKNPNINSRKGLYAFLEHNNIPITHDGCFIAYKSIRNDFYDHHTGTVKYDVGTTVRMPRELCDSDPTQTCSSGLHVAAFGYAKGMNGILVECKIDPEHVVAVPNDYNNEKMRVCELYVVRQISDVNKTVLYPKHAAGAQVILMANGEEQDAIISRIFTNEAQPKYMVRLVKGNDIDTLESGPWAESDIRDPFMGDEADAEDENGNASEQDTATMTDLAMLKKDMEDKIGEVRKDVAEIHQTVNNAVASITSKLEGLKGNG